MTGQPIRHEPVMVAEVLEGLAVRPGGVYIDCTLGDGGHAAAILDASQPNGRLVGFDADPEAIAVASARLGKFGEAAVLVNANFAELESRATAMGIVSVDGVLLDLGISSRQVDEEERGFSFRRPAPLDMRFGPSVELTAEEIVNGWTEEALAEVIGRLGEEPRARRIARAIVAARPVSDAQQLADVIRKASGYTKGRTHPATRTFQALRMAVNREIESLRLGLEQAVRVLRQGGRLVTIAYHSLEDREIKQFIQREARGGEGRLRAITKKVVRPSRAEVLGNRRSRSARLRTAERA